MGTKSFFNKQKSLETKIRGQEKSSIDDVKQDVESVDYVREFSTDKLDFVPQLDFQDPANFVKYGSAKDYYIDLVDSVVQSYPYDGSLTERLKYRNGLVAIQKHEFDKNYPRSVGYADFSDSTYSEDINDLFTIGSAVTFGFGESTTQHYVITDNYSNNLVYNTGSNQVGSIEVDFSTGATVEFWMNKSAFPAAAKTQNEVIFSISNEESDVFQVTTDVTASSTIIACFAKQSSSAEFIYEFNTNLTTIADSNWHHYALAFSTSSTGYVGEFYVDGVFKEKKVYTNGSPSLYLTGTLDATVAASSLPLKLGDGKLSGSIDEMRLWKKTRDAKQIGVNYFYDVAGGGNTDATKVNNDDPLSLSLYYKFNEGNTGATSVDNVVLDYSGRLTDGVWVGYAATSRATGSAIIESGVASEVGSPIIYSTHPEVAAYKTEKTLSGSAYDSENLGSMYDMLPRHISDEDAASGLLIRKMVQIMSSYLDTLHAQITAISELQDGSYVSGSNAKPNPFSKRNLVSYGFDIPDVFIESGVLEEIYFKDEKRLYEDKLFNLKNLIFQNIFNNLNYINKSKGTEKSFRNLFRCFGVDDELVRLNMYADNQEYEIRENFETSQTKRNVIDFSGYNDSQNREVVLYTFADASKDVDETGDSGYIPSSSNVYIPLTFETQFQFPKFVNSPNNTIETLVTASLFGVHSASADTTKTTIGENDLNFKVYANTNTNNKTQFVLTTNIGSVGSLQSSFYENVYENTEWTLAVRTKPREYPFAADVTSSSVFDLEFYGVSYVAGYKLHEFSSSAEVNLDDDIGQFITGSNKRLYIGADRTDITGAINHKTNVRNLSARVWFDHLTNRELQNHARDINVYGRLNPYRNSFIYENGESNSYIPRINTLALHWNYENITGSDSSGKFLIQDITSGSSYTVDPRFNGGEYSKYAGPNYSGQGAGTTANSTNVVDFLFVDTAEQQLPENLYSSDLVEIRQGDDTLFTRESRPSKYYFAVETSLYDTISREMLGFFASIKDFNSLIGDPVNMYRSNYKGLEKLRELFFENVQNEPDLDKYVNLYKWLDGALDSVISNLIPASARTSDKVRNIVESHILERSKYRHKHLALKEYTKEERITKDPNPSPTDINPVPTEAIIIPTGIDVGGAIQNNINIARKLPEEIRKAKRRRERTGLRPKPKADLPYETSDVRAPPDPTTLSSTRQDISPLWYRTRVERGDGQFLATGIDSVDYNRIQTKINQSQIATGSRQVPFVFRADVTRPIGTNVGLSNENRKNYFPNSFRISSGTVGQDGISIHTSSSPLNVSGKPYYDYDDAPDQTYGDNRRTPLEIVDQVNSEKLPGQNYLPFDVMSASTAVSAYQQDLFAAGLEVSIENGHRDFMGSEGSILQGPFTEENVGGYIYRHGNLLETDPVNRKEGYQFNIVEGGSTPAIHINNPRMVDGHDPEPEFTKHRPLGFWLRETAAKRPVNIKNISGSNFFNQYEVVQTAGRRLNNRYYVKSSGVTGTINNTSSLSYDEDGVFFFKDFTVLNRDTTGSNKFVLVNRFSSPGGPEVNSVGYLDVESAELSVYNNLNYRNLVVRLDNNELLTRHTLSGGFDSVLLQPNASFYKPQRNGIYKISSSLGLPEPVFDNSYVNYNIPRTDVQYRWVASSWIARKTGYPNAATLFSTSGLLTASVRNPVFGQNDSDFDYDISSSDYSPIYGYLFSDNIRYLGEGHIEYGVGGNVPVSVAFNATNYVIVGDIDMDQNLFTTASTSHGTGDYYNLPDFSAASAPYILNGLLLSNNGPYQLPSFKQIRGSEHRVGREFRLRNIYRNQLDVASDDRERTVKAGQQFSITQAPTTNKYKPIVQFIDEQSGTIQYEFGNELEYYATTYISSSNQIKDFNLEMGAPNRNVLETDFYKFSSKYNLIRYGEVLYPKRETQFRDIARNRSKYVSFWDGNNLAQRTNATIINSQGKQINASKWLMDVSLTGSTLGYQPERSGELMRFTGSTGITSSLEGEQNARYSFNLGECRPYNQVQLQAGTGAFYTSYGKFALDARLIGQDETIIPEFTISDYVTEIVSQFGGNFSEKSVYKFTLTGSQELAGNNFAETYGKTEEVAYLEELKDFYGEPTAIKLAFNTTKKLLPREGFYPVQRTAQLASQLSSSYSGSITNSDISDVAVLAPAGTEATMETTLLPFWAPGIGYNSIKAGFAVEFPYRSSTNTLRSTASTTVGWDSVAPFEAILSPSEYVGVICHMFNSSSNGYVQVLDSTGSTNRTDGIYELMAHNFFAEIPEFFLEELAVFKSSPEQRWEFEGPFSSSAGVKKFAMDIVIENPSEFIQYGAPQGFGPFPQHYHAPPGMYFGFGNQNPCPAWTNVAGPNGPRGASTTATLIFDPTDFLSTTGRAGQTSFSLRDIVANSTIEHAHSNGMDNFMTNTASLDLFNLDEEGRWTIKSKWECPVLNFTQTEATGGGAPANQPDTYTRGMWHQYGTIDNGGARQRLHVRLQQTAYSNATLTGSLLDAVGFAPQAKPFGRIKSRKVIEEAICAIPYYVDCEKNEEKFFEIPIDFFENRYEQVRRDQVTDDSISDMIRKIDKYVVPPIYDFVGQRDASRTVLTTKKDYEPVNPPISMYFFEFSSELSQQDLANIWQGVMPEIATKAEKEKVVLEHPIADGELLSPTIFRYNGLNSIPNDIRWKIFKVKKRAAKDYYEMVEKLTGVRTYKRSEAGNNSFNWPYDFFSLVELGKMDVEFEVRNETPNRIKDLKGSGYITPEQAVERAISFGQPIEIRSERPDEEPVETPVCSDEDARELQLLINKSQPTMSALGGPIGGTLTPRESSRLQELLRRCPRPEPVAEQPESFEFVPLPETFTPFTPPEREPEREPEFTSPDPVFSSPQPERTVAVASTPEPTFAIATAAAAEFTIADDPDSPDPGSVEAGDPVLCTDQELAELAALIEDLNVMGDEFPLDQLRRLQELQGKC